MKRKAFLCVTLVFLACSQTSNDNQNPHLDVFHETYDAAETKDLLTEKIQEKADVQKEELQQVPEVHKYPHENEVLPITVPEGEKDAGKEANLADPHVIKVGDTWYLYATQTNKKMHAWTSKDLWHWEDAGVIWERTPGSWNSKGGIWAPNVVKIGDKYYLYYTANKQIGVAVGDSPLGPFDEVYDHPLIGGGHGGIGDGKFVAEGTSQWWKDYEEFAIDPFLLAKDGFLYLYFAAYIPQSCIFVMPMKDPVTLKESAKPLKVLEPRIKSWELVVAEGPFVVTHKGKYYLVYSGNAANTVNYAVGVAISDSPLGPFKRQKDNPILHSCPGLDFWGPGHISLVEGMHKDLLMFYHTKTSKENGYDRRLRFTPAWFTTSGLLEVLRPCE